MSSTKKKPTAYRYVIVVEGDNPDFHDYCFGRALSAVQMSSPGAEVRTAHVEPVRRRWWRRSR